MKKRLLILAVAGLALASCSNDEVVESIATSDANAITFRPLTTGMTRAADSHLNAANDKFAVTAWKAGETTTPETNLYIANAVFKTTDGSTFTSETGKYYWPSGYNLDFYAYSPVDDAVANQAVDYVHYNELNVTPGTTIGSQTDLIFAVTKNWGKVDPDGSNAVAAADEPHYIDGDPAGVTINFAHAESKVIIKLKNTNSNIKVTINEVKMGNLYGLGTYTWNVGTNKYTNETNNYDVTDAVSAGYYLNGTWATGGSANVVYTIGMGTDEITDDTPATIARNIFNGTQGARDLTNAVSTREMILIPQAITTGDEYASDDNDATYNNAYISVKLKIQNKENGAYIIGGDDDNWQVAIWPLTALTWKAGHSYTYTVDLAGGGYFPDNKDGTTAKLDPILEGAEIKFVSVSIDNWIVADGVDIGMLQ